ncbi:MAG TPA: XcyI family restriction endonuclease [Bryobacteraceae bacterium]|nr:XcyI family restriction endonuclease [Bryobacteraceae bacterium]
MSTKLLSPSRQVVFHQMLVAARKTVLMDALSEVLSQLEPTVTKKQILAYVPADTQKILAAAGIRDEHIFPVPSVLEKKPTLVGYYRLVLGISQKRFYRKGTGMGPFKSMETRGLFNPKKRPDLDRFCTVMAENLAELVRQISPKITARDVSELPLLTLGAQLYGSNNNAIGKQATLDVFLSVIEIVKNFIVSQDNTKITVHNASKRKVIIALSNDPDIKIQEEFEGKLRNILAIEIKGGTDVSNAHNRAGEAEKSHRKAKKQDYRDYWTIISLAGVDPNMLQQESPTTNSWFDVAQVLAREGNYWKEFRSRFAGAVGIPLD